MFKEDESLNSFSQSGATTNPYCTAAVTFIRPRPGHAQGVGRGKRQIDHAAFGKWPAVVHSDHHAATGFWVCDTQARAEGQRAVGAGEFFWIVTLAGCGRSLVVRAVEGSDPRNCVSALRPCPTISNAARQHQTDHHPYFPRHGDFSAAHQDAELLKPVAARWFPAAPTRSPNVRFRG